jgi:hypothetical protein
MVTRRSASHSLAESLRLQHSAGLLSALAVDEPSSQESSMLSLTLTEEATRAAAARSGRSAWLLALWPTGMAGRTNLLADQ